jgi:hypothetical protein
MLNLICLVFAFVLFVCATFGIGGTRYNLIAAGLAFWVLSLLLGGVASHLH